MRPSEVQLLHSGEKWDTIYLKHPVLYKIKRYVNNVLEASRKMIAIIRQTKGQDVQPCQ